jgi:tetratricopeptide (TPR) repeat protein
VAAKPQFFVLAGAVVLIVLIFVAPRVPSIEGPEPSALATDVARAVSLVQNGNNPMEGIMLLRNVLERDSNYVEAHWQLGLLSVESAQYERAVRRFRKVIELSPKEYSDAYLFLGKSLMSLGHKEEAITVFESYSEILDDEKAKAELESAISELKKDISN